MAEQQEQPGIPLEELFGRLETTKTAEEQPYLVRNLVLDALGKSARETFEKEVDGGLEAALKRGTLVFKWRPLIGKFQLGIETNPDAIECGRRLTITIGDDEINEKLVGIIQREFPSAYESIIERARREADTSTERWAEPELSEEPELVEGFELPIAYIDEKILAQRRFRMLVSLVEQSPTKKIRLSLKETFPGEKPQITWSFRLEKVKDPADKEKQAIRVTERVPVFIYEEFHPDVPHEKRYFHERTEHRTVKLYLHENGELTFDEKTVRNAAKGLKYVGGGATGIREKPPEKHIERIKDRVESHWRGPLALPKNEDIEKPSLNNLLIMLGLGPGKKEWVIENIE